MLILIPAMYKKAIDLSSNESLKASIAKLSLRDQAIISHLNHKLSKVLYQDISANEIRKSQFDELGLDHQMLSMILKPEVAFKLLEEVDSLLFEDAIKDMHQVRDTQDIVLFFSGNILSILEDKASLQELIVQYLDKLHEYTGIYSCNYEDLLALARVV